MMRRNWHMMIDEEKRRRTVEANIHLLFCVALYRAQMEGGRLFLHEHPDTAWSWEHPEMVELAHEEGVMRVLSHGCAFGMTSKDTFGEGLVLKPTGWLTNSRCIAKALNQQCPNLGRAWDVKHRQVNVSQGRARGCAVYPPPLCRAIVRGLAEELRARQTIPRRGMGVTADEVQSLNAVWDEPGFVQHLTRTWRRFMRGPASTTT